MNLLHWEISASEERNLKTHSSSSHITQKIDKTIVMEQWDLDLQPHEATQMDPVPDHLYRKEGNMTYDDA